MSCQFCGKTLEQHLTYRPPGSPQPRMPCLGLRAYYSERPPPPPPPAPELNETKVKVHQLKIWLCELCLIGAGRECHTPGCALYLHDSPGHPINPELYEILQTTEDM